MKKIKVLHIITSLDRGGAELFLIRLIESLKNKNIQNEILCLSGKGSLSKLLAKKQKVHYLNTNKNLFSIFYNLIKLIKFFQKNKYDIIQGWMYHGNFASLVVFLINKKQRVIWNIRQTLYSFSDEKLLTRIVIYLNSYFSNFPEKIIFNSYKSLNQHMKIGFKRKKLKYIPNGIDLKKYKGKKLIQKKKFVSIGHIARFHPMKNHDLLIRIVNYFLNNSKKVKFYLIGKEVSYDNIFFKEQIKKSFVNKNVFLLGENKNVIKFLKNIDILISTSSWGEGFPNVILEATAMGIPCISTNIGDTKKILKNGFLINKIDDHKIFIKKIKKLIDTNNSQKYKNSILGINYIRKNFSMDKISKEYKKIYN